MRQFAIVASVIGGVTAFAGFAIAYRMDLPVGPTDVVLLGFVYAVALIVKKAVYLVAKREMTTV
jgi:ABC-type Mn2+/Zn2+ transport system permease subunit